MASKEVLRSNVDRLMVHRWGKVNMLRLATLCGISLATVQRIRAGNTAVGLDVLDRIAHGFGLQAWHLLAPGLDPRTPPANPCAVSPHARALGVALDRLADPGRVYTIVMQQIDFALENQAAARAPANQVSRERPA